MRKILNFLFIIFCLDLFGQVRISGKTEEIQESGYKDLPSVKISIKGKPNHIFSDEKGMFQLVAEYGDEIIFSSPKYTDRVYKVEDKKADFTLDVFFWEGIKIGAKTFRDERIMPLIILDGIPISFKDFKKINTELIQSVEIVKREDLPQTFYDDKAENGLILIRTKK